MTSHILSDDLVVYICSCLSFNYFEANLSGSTHDNIFLQYRILYSFFVSDPPPIDETKGTCQVNICLILAYVLHTYACFFSPKVNTNELFNGTKLDTKRCNGEKTTFCSLIYLFNKFPLLPRISHTFCTASTVVKSMPTPR